ncbi:hypothetical protein L4X63_12780 [Geomonas sp. Red32]|uniref:hypothetical protein n=1 Tax=Geomonas sp. Red32 TaxID=2912856 RepID=UPI00202CF31B|nr:hypothetical protein [Geomonas sp. Red32]MCM0082466.1 hypothetical protein [Geomonas sp. Red32]
MLKPMSVFLTALLMAGCGALSSPENSKQPSPAGIRTTTELTGCIYPKYLIVGILYAPPGSASYVRYPADSRLLGSSSLNRQSFSDPVSLSTGGALFDASLGNYTQSVDTAYTAAFGLMMEGNSGLTRSGEDSPQGVDHDGDIIFVWLNPAAKLTISGSTSIRWDGYANRQEDPAASPDIVALRVSQLKDPRRIPAPTAALLARSWDTTVGGLTTADYASILAADPFASGEYDPANDDSYRFDLQTTSGGNTFTYGPDTQVFTVTPRNASSRKQLAKYNYSVDCYVDGPVDFTYFVSNNLKISKTYTTTASWNSSTSSSAQPATFSITGPSLDDNYTGPTTFQVWRDNLFGSYMFYPVAK